MTRFARTVCFAAPIVALALSGCERGAILDVSGREGASDGFESESVLTFFSGPTPVQAVRWATNLRDPDKRVRGILLLANAPWGGEDVYLRLYRSSLEDEDAGVRAVAVRALALHGSPEDVPRIIELLNGGNDLEREEASRGLQRLHASEAVQPLLLHADEREEENWKVRQACAVALGQYAEGRVVDRLIDSLNDTELSVNRAALRSLRVLTGQDFGLDARSWLTWAGESGDVFAGRGVYEYPIFFRDPSVIEMVVPWMEVPNEVASTPVGMDAYAAGTVDRENR